MQFDEKYMRRALQLARYGESNTSPNPMVGAVIVDSSGRIIGEGYHRKCGEGHAEVNAIASVSEKDRLLLNEATMYVTLEPCSHYGKTPPCAKLIIETGIPRVVVGALDPFKEVSGRGIAMLKDAGIEVVTDVLGDESRHLNRKFITAHVTSRPYVTLKWAQSSDGFTDIKRQGGEAYKFSDVLNSTLVHRLRSLHDCILIGSTTAINDNPMLNCRLWPGRSPRPIIADRTRKTEAQELRVNNPLIISDCNTIDEILRKLYSLGFTSVLVEGGPTLLKSFIDSGLWDSARVETAPVQLGQNGCAAAPQMPGEPDKTIVIGRNTIRYYNNNPRNFVKNL